MRTWLLLAAATMAAAITGCDRSEMETLSPTAIQYDSTASVSSAADTTPKDTVLAVLPTRYPTVDSLVFSFVSVTGGTATRTSRILRKDSVASFPLDTGTGRIWRLKVQGRKGGRLWWTLDSIRVVPDSTRRIVLDSAWRRLTVADTSTAVEDTNLYVAAASLTGDALPLAGTERGLFFRYDAGVLSLSLVSDGDVQGENYDRILNAAIGMAFSAPASVGAVSFENPTVNAVEDSYDSSSTVLAYTDSLGRVTAVYGNLFARYRLKRISVPVSSRCTVEVAVTMRSGVIPLATPSWTMPSLSDDTTKALLFLGSGRTHPKKTRFRIVIP